MRTATSTPTLLSGTFISSSRIRTTITDSKVNSNNRVNSNNIKNKPDGAKKKYDGKLDKGLVSVKPVSKIEHKSSLIYLGTDTRITLWHLDRLCQQR